MCCVVLHSALLCCVLDTAQQGTKQDKTRQGKAKRGVRQGDKRSNEPENVGKTKKGGGQRKKK